MKNEKIILRVPRSAMLELVVLTGEFWNIKVLDIRWHENGKPTRKGVRMNMDEAAPVLQAIRRALDDNINTNDENDVETTD